MKALHSQRLSPGVHPCVYLLHTHDSSMLLPSHAFAHSTASEMGKPTQQNTQDTSAGDFLSMLILLALETTQIMKSSRASSLFTCVAHHRECTDFTNSLLPLCTFNISM